VGGIRIRRGVVVSIDRVRPGALELLVEVDGAKAPAIAYPELTGPVSPGDRVVVNTGAVALGLGTGGVHFVIAVSDGPDVDPDGPGHAMKLRYTPAQLAVEAAEDVHRDALDAFDGLAHKAVVVSSLHSGLAPACVAAKAFRPDVRVAYVMTEGGSLALAFSETVGALREHGLLDATITAGQAFGGHLETVNRFSGIAVASAVAGADLIVVGAGPGNLGTASRLGFALMEAGENVNAIAALGGRPIVAPRLSFADTRERHRGISHHTLTALGTSALAPAEIALPPLSDERRAFVAAQFRGAPGLDRHRVVDVEIGDDVERAIRDTPVPFSSMGRSFDDDPDCFRTPAAAALLALGATGRVASIP
jgi:Protein of unknown function (DUF3866)